MSFGFKDRTLAKVGVIGSGNIGPDIALFLAKIFSRAGTPVVVVDILEQALKRGREKVTKKIYKGVETGAFTPDQEKRMIASLDFTRDYGKLSDADMIVEAASEDLALKRKIFKQLEEICAPTTIFTSNSSHLEPETIFEEVSEKRRALVVHYFFPAERNPVVEVVPAKFTDPAEVRFLMDLYEAMGKVPIRVRSRYGYALDPVFEGVFLAAALLHEEGVATTKQIDAVAMSSLGLVVGPFTAMNLTGGNPITNVGLDNYHEKLHAWYRSPKTLKRAVETRQPWDVPARGEKVDVPPPATERITKDLRAAYFGLACEVLDAGLTNVSDFDMALEMALDMKPAFRFMNEIGTGKALALVKDYAARHPDFPVAKSLVERGGKTLPWKIATVLREDVGETAIVTIRRPKVLNALNRDVFEQLLAVFGAIKEDPAITSAVLTGFGTKAFVSGADVRFLAGIRTPEEGVATSKHSQSVLDFIENLGKPVVCAMNGLAFGGGLELAMACTARICVADFKVLAAQPEPNLGIIPGAGGTQRLPRLIGLEPAAALLRTGKPIGSVELVELGLCLEEVRGDLKGRAVQLAREIASGKTAVKPIERGPLPNVPRALLDVSIGHLSRAVDAILCRVILEGAKLPLRQGLELEAAAFGEVCTTQDMRIGIDNFLRNGPRSKANFVHA